MLHRGLFVSIINPKGTKTLAKTNFSFQKRQKELEKKKKKEAKRLKKLEKQQNISEDLEEKIHEDEEQP